jgi:hypothetical protein
MTEKTKTESTKGWIGSRLEGLEKTLFSIKPGWVLLAGATVFSILILGIFLIFKIADIVDEPFMGGFLNTTFFGIQIYLYLAIPAVILYLAAYIWWVKLKWQMMSPFHGLWSAINSQSEVVFVSDLNLNFHLMGEFAAKVIFDKERYNAIAHDTSNWLTRMRMWLMPVDEAVHTAKFLQGSWDSKPMTNIGSVPAGILLDVYGWTKAVSPQRSAIGRVADTWNDLNIDDQIHSMSKAWKYMAEGKIDTPDGVKLYVTVPWVRIDNAYPKKRYQSERGGFIRQIALNIVNGVYSRGLNMTTAAIFVFCVCVALSLLMFWMKYSTHVATAVVK